MKCKCYIKKECQQYLIHAPASILFHKIEAVDRLSTEAVVSYKKCIFCESR